MYEKIDFDSIDTTMEPPVDELNRQYFYIAKASGYVKKLSIELGRKPFCCVTTFGCQMNAVPEKERVKII